MNKIVAGQKVWLTKTNLGEPIEAEVSYVGWKYFSLKDYKHRQFNVLTLLGVGDFSKDMRVYLTKQEILDNIERQALLTKLRRVFNNDKFTLEQLKAVHTVLYPDDLPTVAMLQEAYNKGMANLLRVAGE